MKQHMMGKHLLPEFANDGLTRALFMPIYFLDWAIII